MVHHSRIMNVPTDLDVFRYTAELNTTPVQTLSRRTAQEVACPFCHAEAGFPCIGTHGRIRRAIHKDRYIERVRVFMLSEDEPFRAARIQTLSPDEWWESLSSSRPKD
jgi:hypothetical protein